MSRRPRASIRWWPAAVILTLTLAALLVIWLRDAPSLQDRVIPTFPTLFFSALALVAWLVLFSRLPGRTRFKIFLALALVTALGFATLEIKGVDGNLVPILGPRWSGERGFDAAASAQETAPTASAGDYPQFYGPARNATLAGPRLARDWERQPPRELWRRPVGEGWSGFAVAGDAAITQELRGEEEVVVRYRLATGEPVWVHGERAPFNTTVGGSGPRATPTIAEGRVYVLGATGNLAALDLADGRPLWSVNVLADNDAKAPDWGMSSSPLVTGDLVIVQLGRRGTSLAAYDRATGARAWRAGSDPGSYTSPIVVEVAGRRQLIVVNQTSVAGHDPSSGERLWREAWPGGEKITPPLPLGDDRLLVSAGYGIGSRLLRLLPEGAGLRAEELWASPRLKSKFAPMVEHEGVVYGLDDGILVALDPETGERLWKRGRYGHGQLILVDDLLLIQTEPGDVVLVEANPAEHRELARLTALSAKTWNPPALAGALLLVRNNREAACFELPLAP